MYVNQRRVDNNMNRLEPLNHFHKKVEYHEDILMDIHRVMAMNQMPLELKYQIKKFYIDQSYKNLVEADLHPVTNVDNHNLSNI